MFTLETRQAYRIEAVPGSQSPCDRTVLLTDGRRFWKTNETNAPFWVPEGIVDVMDWCAFNRRSLQHPVLVAINRRHTHQQMEQPCYRDAWLRWCDIGDGEPHPYGVDIQRLGYNPLGYHFFGSEAGVVAQVKHYDRSFFSRFRTEDDAVRSILDTWAPQFSQLTTNMATFYVRQHDVSPRRKLLPADKAYGELDRLGALDDMLEFVILDRNNASAFLVPAQTVSPTRPT